MGDLYNFIYTNYPEALDDAHTEPHVHWAATPEGPIVENYSVDSRPEPLTTGNLAADDPAEEYIRQLAGAIAKAISKEITDRGWTQTEAAEVLGVSQPRISDLARGKVDRFGLRHLLQLANKMEVPMTVLIGKEVIDVYDTYLEHQGLRPI